VSSVRPICSSRPRPSRGFASDVVSRSCDARQGRTSRYPVQLTDRCLDQDSLSLHVTTKMSGSGAKLSGRALLALPLSLIIVEHSASLL
jgi:hypothetical protein